jgi:hypothetical protein
MRWLVLVTVAGCWAGEADGPAVVESTTPIAQTPHPTQQVWAGRYICTQGPTHVVVTLERDGAQLKGTFEFSALPENPSVPHGLYSMTGTATTAANGEVTVRLVPGEWIERPGNYEMVGLEAHTDRERRLLTGKITYPGCTTVELARAR